MILQQLFADSEAILQDSPTPPMYDNILVQWGVQLTADGKLKGSGFVNLGDKGGSRHLIPYNYGRAVDIVPNLLVDTADYALGVLDKNAVKKHQAFLALVRQCAQATQDPLVQAVLRFLEGGGVPAELLHKELKTKDRILFTVNGDEPSNQQAVKDFWRELTEHECKGREKPRGRCLITGEDGFVERILPCEVRVDRESAPLISVNEAAGNSYGFEQALNGAVSLRAAEGFTKALNALMRNPATRLNVGDVTYVFWRRSGPDTEASEVLNRPDEGSEIVKRLLNTPYRPKEKITDKSADAQPEKFYALALSGNKTRVVFRDWMAIDDWQIKENLKTWLLAQRIVSPDGDTNSKPHYFSVFQLSAALYRESKEVLKADAPALVRTALHGDPIPRRMLAAVIGRCGIERRVTHARAALLKLVLTHHDQEKATLMENPDNMDRFNDNAPYVCGRLLAVLESLQYAALGPVNSNVIDRYFSAAAAEPKRILLGILLPQAEKAYLAKLRRQKPGLYFTYGERIRSLTSQLIPADALGISTLPKRLSLEQQADFLLGFYHQKAADTAAKNDNIEKKAKKAAAKQNEPEDTQPTLTTEN
jgi:CRISPR-associated protein Csd1